MIIFMNVGSEEPPHCARWQVTDDGMEASRLEARRSTGDPGRRMDDCGVSHSVDSSSNRGLRLPRVVGVDGVDA